MAKTTASNQPLTKPDLVIALNKYVTKSDLKKTERILRAEILKVEEKVENIEESQKRTETTLNKISNQLDGFVGRVDNLTNDNEIGTEQIHELREDVKDHGKRLIKLETAN